MYNRSWSVLLANRVVIRIIRIHLNRWRLDRPRLSVSGQLANVLLNDFSQSFKLLRGQCQWETTPRTLTAGRKKQTKWSIVRCAVTSVQVDDACQR